MPSMIHDDQSLTLHETQRPDDELSRGRSRFRANNNTDTRQQVVMKDRPAEEAL